MKRIADIVFVAAVIVLLGIAGFRHFSSDGTQQVGSDARAEVIPAGAPHAAGPRESSVAVLYLKPGCPFCEYSMPFYRRLLQEVGPDRVLFQVYGGREDFDRYLSDFDIGTPTVVNLAVPEQIRATPTMVVVDSAGLVSHSWVGRLSESQENEVLAALR